jgi:hypothetical protein
VVIAPQYLVTFSRLEIHHYISSSKGNPNNIKVVIYFLYGSYTFDVPNFIPANTQWCCAEVKLQTYKGKCKAIPLQALTGPEGSRRVRLPDFKTTGT